MKVLIVEDNEIMQRLYDRALRLAGITFVGVGDGSLALEAALREHPEIIMMDVMMPKMNGLEALKILKANDQTKGIPVIMLSAYQEDKLLIDAMNSGADRYLVKSNLEPTQIVDIIKEVAAASKSNQ